MKQALDPSVTIAHRAKEYGSLLGYSSNGSRLVDLIRGAWRDEFQEGRDYDVLKGLDFKDFLLVAPDQGGAKVHHIMLLYITGYDKVRLLTTKRPGTILRDLIATKIFP